jgi:hypothetical protein
MNHSLENKKAFRKRKKQQKKLSYQKQKKKEKKLPKQ